ncbi:hypothetical protein [Carnobacterium sp. TMP28]|uniref:hypothetical protein n=1 Tax=Carnobacterium sp. TMP28 TaxID=3397060 RepID=UPI0039DF3B92
MIWKSKHVHIKVLKKLIPDIIEIRKPGKYTHSCKSGYPIIETLTNISTNKFYKKDFETNTKEFFSKEVSYKEVIKSLKEVIESGLLPEVIS